MLCENIIKAECLIKNKLPFLAASQSVFYYFVQLDWAV